MTTTTNTATKIVKNVPVSGLQNGMDYVQLGDSDLIVSKVCSKFNMIDVMRKRTYLFVFSIRILITPFIYKYILFCI
jgi:hypothetical protein